jgi:hypothetical protein
VSLLDRLGRGHLTDAQFAELWATSQSAVVTHPHLDGCADCRARFTAFDRWVNGIGDELRTEADEAFPAERLTLQQAQIARRLETLERPARVLTFPKAARAVISGNSHVRGWVTVAVAASLIAGFGLGQIVQLPGAVLRTQKDVTTTAALTQPQTQKIAKDLTPVSTSINDEELLSDALTRSRVTTLNALDDMTPHTRDVVPARRGK